MVFVDLPMTERVRRIHDLGFAVEIWNHANHDVDALVATGATFSSMTGYVTGGLTDEVGGDAFDYSLSERSASLAIFDPVGHTLGSGLIAAVALSAYRSCRRFGGDLAEQVSSIDDTVGAQFSSGAFAAGVLAELALDTGRLRYVNAGHPQPLIMRGGKVVKPLAGGLRRGVGVKGVILPTKSGLCEAGDVGHGRRGSVRRRSWRTSRCGRRRRCR